MPSGEWRWVGWGIASNLQCQSEGVTHKQVMLEQDKVQSSTACDRALCLWGSLGTEEWPQPLEAWLGTGQGPVPSEEEAGDRPPSQLLSSGS